MIKEWIELLKQKNLTRQKCRKYSTDLATEDRIHRIDCDILSRLPQVLNTATEVLHLVVSFTHDFSVVLNNRQAGLWCRTQL